MSKLTDKLAAQGMHNSWEFFGAAPYISLRANQGSRDVLPSAWKVRKAGLELSTSWYDYGAKSFSYAGRAGNKEALQEAKDWASKEFGIKDWARDPYGSWGEAGYVKRRIEELTKAASE